MRGPFLVTLTICALALAGCSETAPVPEEEDLGLDDYQATATTGYIKGVVVDETISPLAGVTVLGPDGLTATSNELGAYGLPDLDAGDYCLMFSKIGYDSIQVCTTVVAGVEPETLRTQMVSNPDLLPYADLLKFKGMVRCGLSYIAACGAFGIVGQDVGDRFMATFPLDTVPEHITMEAVWEGTQPTGDNFQLRLGHSPAGPATVDATATGPSPQQAWVNATTIKAVGLGPGNDLVGRMFVWEMEGTNIQQHTGQCVPVVLTTWCHGPGAAIDQAFDLYTHIFHGFAPPEDWQYTNDGDPVAPS